MPTTRPGRWVLVVVLALPTLLTGGVASAHSALIGSNPEPGSVVRQLPDHVELRFNESLKEISPAAILRRDDETVATLEPEIDGPVLRAATPTDLDDGEYTLVWRVVSGDGHPIDGVVPFTLSASGEAPAVSAPTERTAPAANYSTPAVALAVAAPVVLVLAAGVVLLRRRRCATPTNPKDTP